MLTLQRDEPTNSTRTTGRLYLPTIVLHTLEHPWRPEAPGGKPFTSCVPSGRYQLVPHTRANGDKVVALVNHGLGVYYLPTEKPHDVGRDLILIHKANWLKDIEGCIAPGIGFAPDTVNGYMVTESAEAMKHIMAAFAAGEDELEIRGTNSHG